MLLVILFRVIDMLIGAYITVLFARMILDWVTVLSPRWYPTGVIASLISVVYRLTEPRCAGCAVTYGRSRWAPSRSTSVFWCCISRFLCCRF